MESQFGKGLVYCLGLFLAHADRWEELKNQKFGAMRWFDGAKDHIFELETDVPELNSDIENWKDAVLNPKIGISSATEEDVLWAIQGAKDLLLKIDRNCLGIDAIKGDCE